MRQRISLKIGLLITTLTVPLTQIIYNKMRKFSFLLPCLYPRLGLRSWIFSAVLRFTNLTLVHDFRIDVVKTYFYSHNPPPPTIRKGRGTLQFPPPPLNCGWGTHYSTAVTKSVYSKTITLLSAFIFLSRYSVYLLNIILFNNVACSVKC